MFLASSSNFVIISIDDDSASFRGAVKKFQKLFNMPPEEKLVNCK